MKEAMKFAFTFPGQGSQHQRMGADLAAQFACAQAVFDEIDEALGDKLSTIIREGSQAELTLTENAQPALMAVSMALITVMKQEFGFNLADRASYVAGHSLGEYSALAAAGTFSLSDTAKLLRIRGKAMQQAVPVGEGAMAALLGLDFSDAKKLAEQASQGEICSPANDNAPGQVVISGTRAAIQRAVEMASEFGARRAIMLDVSAPFHCALMQPAGDVMQEALSCVQMQAPSVPLIANVISAPVLDPDDIRKYLVEQVTGVVRWRESIAMMAADGVDTLYEVGAGRVLTGLVRRIDKSLQAESINSVEDITKFIENIR